MKKFLLLFFCLFFFFGYSIKVNADNSKEYFYYKFQKGDTLWGISDFFYDTGLRWQDIANINKDEFKSHYNIPIDTTVKVPKKDSVLKVLGRNYVARGDNVYLMCWDEYNLIKHADLDSFDTLNSEYSSNSYSKDKNHVYKGTEIFKGVDPESFEVINMFVYKDKNNVYYNDRVLKDADPATFKYLAGPVSGSDKVKRSLYDWYKDKNNVYYEWKKVEDADPETFEVLYNEYAKDKNHVYEYEHKIGEADADTFEIVDKHIYAKDKNHVYKFGEVVEDADPENFDYNKN